MNKALLFTNYYSIALFHTFVLSQAQSDPALASSLSGACVSLISQYPPTESLYASQVCHVCQGLGLTAPVDQCCGAADPTACFANSLFGVTATGSSSTATLGLSETGYPITNCYSVTAIFTSCLAATPAFQSLCFHDQQSCLCSTWGIAAPDYYDNYWSSCLSYLSEYEPSEYSMLGPDSNGNVQSRKCSTWQQLTATGGVPSNCLTSPSNTASSTSLNPLDSTTSTQPPARSSSTSGGAATGAGSSSNGQVRLEVSLRFRSPPNDFTASRFNVDLDNSGLRLGFHCPGMM